MRAARAAMPTTGNKYPPKSETEEAMSWELLKAAEDCSMMDPSIIIFGAVALRAKAGVAVAMMRGMSEFWMKCELNGCCS